MLILSLAACPDGTGGIATAFRFEDKAPPASFNIRSAGGPLFQRMEGTKIDEASFAEFKTYYDDLGTLVGSITPTEFSLMLGGGSTVTAGQVAELFSSGDLLDAQKIDFKNGVVVTPSQNAEPGATTTSVDFSFMVINPGIPGPEYGNYGSAKALATFTIPQGVADDLRAKAAAWKDQGESATEAQYYDQKSIYSLEGTTITVEPSILLPHGLTGTLFQYTGDTYRYTDEAIEGFIEGAKRFVIPMKPITIPADAKSVTYNATLDLDGIIEQYPGEDGNANTADDVFVLANHFWERLAIGATY